MTLVLENLSRRFGGVAALDGVSLEIPDGSLFALLGPSGSGKTTLLRVLGGLDFPDAGRVVLGGQDITLLPAQARRVGFVFQNYALFRHMTAAANIAFGLSVRPRAERPGREAIRKRVRELLALVQLDGLGHRFPDQLSGGQRQRVALARALAIEPRLLLLDEPFGALDAKVRHELRQWLRVLHEQTGLTTVLVTHDQQEAMELADRIAILRDGRIEQEDTPDTLYHQPASAFVHGFMGEASRLACRVRAGRASLAALPGAALHTDAPDGLYTACVRDHAFVVGPADDGVAMLVAARPSGAVVRLSLDIDGTPIEAAVPAEAVPPALRPPGSTWRVVVNHARLFPLSGSGAFSAAAEDGADRSCALAVFRGPALPARAPV